MGTVLSFQQPGPPPDGAVAISINEWDKLRVIHPTPGLEDALEAAIKAGWDRGIQRVDKLGGVVQWKMNGNPWHAEGESAVMSRMLTVSLLNTANQHGLELVCASDVSRAFTDASSFFFHRRQQSTTGYGKIIAVSTNEGDKLRLIGASGQEQQSLNDVIRDAISGGWHGGKWWPNGLQDQRTYGGKYNVPEFKIKGWPWWANGEDAVHVRRMVTALLRGFERCGYEYWMAADVSKKSRDSDTIYFRQSLQPPNPAPEWCSISFAESDKMRIIGMEGGFPSGVVDDLRKIAQSHWPKGIQREREYAGSFEFKFHGYPWWADGQNAVHARQLCIAMLSTMLRHGWEIRATIDIMRKDSDKSSWFFSRRKGVGAQPNPPTLMCLSLNDSDKIRIIGGSSQGKAAAVQIVRNAIMAAWPKPIQREQDYYGSHEFKLKGNPWWSHGSDALYSRSLLCHISKGFVQAGLQPIASADVSAKYIHQENGPDYPVDVHSWFIMEGGAPGARGMASPGHADPYKGTDAAV